MQVTYHTVAKNISNMGLSSSTILLIISIYFLVLIGVSYFTSRKSDTNSFFTANRSSPWLLVAIGMIGASLSGVTFISVPGKVGVEGANSAFSYMQVVFGYLVGYFLIAVVLMPIYYRQKLISIYGYLENRFGVFSYKVGAAYFLLSRILGASFRLFLVSAVLHSFVLEDFGISFGLTVAITIVLIWVYTFAGGIKTIVYTDTLQTVCMILAVITTIYFLLQGMDLDLASAVSTIYECPISKVFHFDTSWGDPNNFYKQFIGGALIALVMTGLDQDMMQKNLTCRNLGAAQKNILVFSVILIFANLLFLSLGALLYEYAAFAEIAIPEKTDFLYPTIALEHLPPIVGISFIIGLIAAAYSSADSALTSLTTSFCVDFLDFEKSKKPESQRKNTRLLVHIGFSLLLFLVIILFREVSDTDVITILLKVAGYTYGPLLGLFAFGILTNYKIRDVWSPLVCLLTPILSFSLSYFLDKYYAFDFGNIIIAVNGLMTFLGLLIIVNRKSI